MNYYFYNTDADSLVGPPRPRFHRLIEERFAATGGPRRYGEQLRRLKERDTLLMYEDGMGIVAVGTVVKPWNGEAHKDLLYYQASDKWKEEEGREREYRIAVEWDCDLSKNPMSIKEIRKRLGYREPWAPRKAISGLKKCPPEQIRTMVDELRLSSRPTPTYEATDLHVPDRVVTTAPELPTAGENGHDAKPPRQNPDEGRVRRDDQQGAPATSQTLGTANGQGKPEGAAAAPNPSGHTSLTDEQLASGGTAAVTPKCPYRAGIKTWLLTNVGIPLLTILVGFGIALHFYKKAGDDLRWEARAGTIPLDKQEVLLAVHEAGGELKPGQAIRTVGNGGRTVAIYRTDKVLFELGGGLGLVGLYIRNGQETKELDRTNAASLELRVSGLAQLRTTAADPKWRREWLGSQDASLDDLVVRLKEEGKGVAQYLMKCRRFPSLPVEIWETTGQSGSFAGLREEDLVKRISPPSDATNAD